MRLIRLFVLVSFLAHPAFAQRTSFTPYGFKQDFPTEEAAQKARDDADLQRAVTAYRFWYPTVSVEGVFNGMRQKGIEDNKTVAVFSASPRQLSFTANSDTPYGTAVLDLSAGPMVIELPPGPFIGFVNDHNQGWVLNMGIPGPDVGTGGKYVVVPPDYKWVPEGHFRGQSLSLKNLIAVRTLPSDGGVKGALDAMRKIKVYPLETAKSPKLLEFKDLSDTDMDGTLLRWEDNIHFWETLHKVINAEPLLEKFFPMYGLLAELGIEKGKPFAPDARMTAILERAAKVGRDQMLVSAFDSGRPDRINWPDRKWEWVGLTSGGAESKTPKGIDLEARDGWFAQAIVTSPAMFRRSAEAGSLYWLSARDSTGAYLDGGKNYKLTMPQPVPAKLFWSVTVYAAATRSQVKTDQNKAALRSMFELNDVTGSAPVDLYFGPKAPAGQDNRWIKTEPGKGWFAYIRIYGPEQAAFDKSWKPGDFEEEQ
jgi:hypothetical protein